MFSATVISVSGLSVNFPEIKQSTLLPLSPTFHLKMFANALSARTCPHAISLYWNLCKPGVNSSRKTICLTENNRPSVHIFLLIFFLPLCHHWCFAGGGSAQNHKAAGDRLTLVCPRGEVIVVIVPPVTTNRLNTLSVTETDGIICNCGINRQRYGRVCGRRLSGFHVKSGWLLETTLMSSRSLFTTWSPSTLASQVCIADWALRLFASWNTRDWLRPWNVTVFGANDSHGQTYYTLTPKKQVLSCALTPLWLSQLPSDDQQEN